MFSCAVPASAPASRPLGARLAEHLAQPGRGEVIVSRGHRRVRGEDALLRSRSSTSGLSSASRRSRSARLLFEQRHRQQRRMALVHVVALDVACARARAASARRRCRAPLPGTGGSVRRRRRADRSAAVPRDVLRQSGVEQIDRNLVAGDARHVYRQARMMTRRPRS